jgi:phospholipase/carboxylesterase
MKLAGLYTSGRITRREFGAMTGGVLASAAFSGACRIEGEAAGADDGRLTARPLDRVTTTESGQHTLGLASGRDAVLRMPANVPAGPMPLLVLLHGAGGTGEKVLGRLGTASDDAGIAVLAPDSRGPTWDAIRGGFGRDVVYLNSALEHVFQKVSVDPSRLVIGGFSDGATYALSVGIINGDLFPRVIAFSPGFLIDGVAHGKPRVFVSHGTKDDILPIDRCSRRIVPALRNNGHEVTFREFDGGHEMQPAVVTEAMQWLAAK